MRRAFVCALLFVGCARTERTSPPSRDAVVRELARCSFDDLSRDPDKADVETALRRELHRDRHAFAVRAGRCGTVLDADARARDPGLRALGEAWDTLLPMMQSPAPDAMALDLAVRHVGNAWREVQPR